MIFTIGHSTHPIAEFIAWLKAWNINKVVDIRTYPRSRYNPQYNRDALNAALAENGITYQHMKNLGGLRHAAPDSPNQGWRNLGFRGYADYMQTAEFRQGLEEIIAMGKEMHLVLMCAEAVPWRCHRNLTSDALVARGVDVRHIIGAKLQEHVLTPFARVVGGELSYPPEQPGLPL